MAGQLPIRRVRGGSDPAVFSNRCPSAPGVTACFPECLRSLASIDAHGTKWHAGRGSMSQKAGIMTSASSDSRRARSASRQCRRRSRRRASRSRRRSHAPEGGVMYAFSAPPAVSLWKRNRPSPHSPASAAGASARGGACGVSKGTPWPPTLEDSYQGRGRQPSKHHPLVRRDGDHHPPVWRHFSGRSPPTSKPCRPGPSP